MNCAQVKEQLVDYLYGELTEPARSAFAEHLRGCPGCSAEVSSHESCVGQARRALAGPLMQEPPARVRLAVLEAAKLHARAAKQASSPEQPGFFARLWRTPWLLPAFGAASVATAVLLVRVLKDPEAIPGQRPTRIEEAPPAESEPVPVPAASEPFPLPGLGARADRTRAEAMPADASKKEWGKGGKSSAGRAAAVPAAPKAKAPSRAARVDELDGLAREGGAGSSRFAEPPPPRRAAKPARDVDDLSGTFKDDRFAAPPAEAAPRAAAAPASRDEERTYGRPPVPMGEQKARVPEPARSAARQPTPSAVYAPPPPPPAAAPAPAYAPPPVVQHAPANAPATKAAPQAGKKKAGAGKREPFAAADMDDADKELAGSPSKGGPSLDETVKRADRLFAAQEWSAAAAAYRDLVNRYPGHKDAAQWRARLSQALVAEEQARAAKAKRTSPFND